MRGGGLTKREKNDIINLYFAISCAEEEIMKKTSVRLLALCLAVLMLSVAMASCGKRLNGIYENNTLGLHITYTFSGNKYTRTMSGLTEYDTGITVSGTYRIAKGYIYLVSENGSEETLTCSKSGKTIYIAEMDFQKQ